MDEGPRMVDRRLIVAGNGPMVKDDVERVVEPGVIGLGRGNFERRINFESRDISLCTNYLDVSRGLALMKSGTLPQILDPRS